MKYSQGYNKLCLKPIKNKHFAKGSKICNTLLTRIRLNRSDLKLYKFTIGHSESAECSCHSKNESSLHYLTKCFLQTGESQTLYNLHTTVLKQNKTNKSNTKYL